MAATRASDIMTKDVTVIREEETMSEAARRLADDDIGVLPITDDQKNLKGILTDRDIVVHVIARKGHQSDARARSRARRDRYASAR
jgi:CBS-domain-containing membrane protein